MDALLTTIPADFIDHQQFSTRLCQLLSNRVISLALFTRVNTRFHDDTSRDYDTLTRVDAYSRWFVALAEADATCNAEPLRAMAGAQ